jgi:hypothetical protein
MKYFIMVLMITGMLGCGTVGGAMKGAGDDLNRAGEYVKNVGR